jgi:hypothetical protein
LLTIEELDKINTYLWYLAQGIENNRLTKVENKEVMDLGCRCLDMADELEKIKEFNDR